jgi:hypothetical protein
VFKTGQCSKNNDVQNVTVPRQPPGNSRKIEKTVGIAHLGCYQHEGVMHLSASHMSGSRRPSGTSKRGLPKNRLPRSFPVGTTYVIEGRGGEEGHLQVFSRYVVLPDGKRINLGPDSLASDPCSDDFSGPAAPRKRARARGQVRARTAAKRRSRPAKKIIAAGGTRRRRRR